MTQKEMADPVKTQESLKNLRDELMARVDYSHDIREVVFKINSCLFSEYPHEHMRS